MNYSYIVKGQKVKLEPINSKIAIRFHEPSKRSDRFKIINKINKIDSFDKRLELTKEKYTVFDTISVKTKRTFNKLNSQLKMVNEIANSTPVFKSADNLVIPTDRLLIGFNKPEKVNQLINEINGEIIDKEGNEYVIKLNEVDDIFEIISKLDKNPEIDYAEPDFIILGKHLPRLNSKYNSISNFSNYSQFQYALDITKSRDAWKYIRGNKTINIAILDEGVDSFHEDLQSAIVGNYDGTDNDEFQEPFNNDAHGTACAGLVAAIGKNHIGNEGVGSGCSLLAVRIAFSNSIGRWETRNHWIARSIDWSWKNGADVLSNSWGGGLPSTKIINAFERARTKGRNGKGCIIVAAAGNDSGAVSFPGSLVNVLTVSASNEFDQPKTKTSADGESWWGTNFGKEVDICAPGVHNYTTDISGKKGYNDGSKGINENYVDNFNGTSSSTPIVSGCIGLLLSINSNLTEKDIRKIIKETADKVGNVTYNKQGHNSYMGYGRLNVLKAVLRVIKEQK
ncbi:calcium-dependent protease [Kordia sp. SMS9]|uniref:S8 family serine peptidase n=1 Tax=Kordia sp. SMS9 TaxID=2282170 RepID=UPI000E0D7E7A|nr:S8 family serine peptidase [Kordia sp. SMS9]AXG71285.1 calcium-dependent protease [Kordia sp. SMS9]